MRAERHARDDADGDELDRALGELDGLSRAALHMIYRQGRTQSDTARQLHITQEEVGRRVARALHDIGGRLCSPAAPIRTTVLQRAATAFRTWQGPKPHQR